MWFLRRTAWLAVLIYGAGIAMPAAQSVELPAGVKLVPAERGLFPELDAEIARVWPTFLAGCRSIASASPELRVGRPPSDAFRSACAEALNVGDAPARQLEFFTRRFRPHEIVTEANPSASAFLTGYYEPVVEGSLNPEPGFTEPLLARPSDLLALSPAEVPTDFPTGATGARRTVLGAFEPYPTRAQIDAGAIRSLTTPVAWVRDAIEAFMIQVQGSAAVRLSDGRLARLTYAGRNGRPYTSIGRILVETGEVPLSEMSLVRLKQWVRDKGQRLGEKGRELLHRNESFVFFSLDESTDRSVGPIGAAGVPLTALRSIAIDRNIWAYGLPFWVEADLPWEDSARLSTFRRLLIAQDTGSAIIGAARADLYFGSGDKMGVLAGGIRHPGRMFVFLPTSGGTDGK